MLISHFPTGPLGCNCIILAEPPIIPILDQVETVAQPFRRSACIIDPGGSLEKIMEVVDQNNLLPVWVVITHAHADHVLAAGRLREETGAKIVMHIDDRWLYRTIEIQAFLLTGRRFRAPKIDEYLVGEDRINFGKEQVISIHTPGHTPGSCCFVHPITTPVQISKQENPVGPSISTQSGGLKIESAHYVMATGDTLMRETIGRTNLPGGSRKAIVASIRNKLYKYPPDTIVIPGHGPNTTIGYEMLHNNFIKALTA